MSDTSIAILNKLNLVLLAGVSGSGRNTIIDGLIKLGGYHYIVSDTTREPRVNNGIKEQNGDRYWFKSETEFLRDLKCGMYLEAEIIHNQQVSGISLRELQKALDDNKIAITDIELGGFRNILGLKPDTIGVIVLPPSFDEWLRRLTKRGRMKDDEIKNRLKSGCRLFAQAITATSNISIVVNDNIETVITEIDMLAQGKIVNNTLTNKRLAKDLLRFTKEYLSR